MFFNTGVLGLGLGFGLLICMYISITIYTARAEYFLIPDDAVDRRKLGF